METFNGKNVSTVFSLISLRPNNLPVNEEATEIMHQSMALFMRYGIKSITMDDLARELGKSKKTLYLYIDSKDDLLYKSLEAQLAGLHRSMEELRTDSSNAIDECIRIQHFNFEFIRELNPSVMYDLQKYHPRAWSLFEQHKNVYIFQSVKQNLERGQREGVYREDMNPAIIARYHVHKIEMFTDANLFLATNVNRMDAYREVMHYHLQGVMSEKGRVYFQQQNPATHG